MKLSAIAPARRITLAAAALCLSGQTLLASTNVHIILHRTDIAPSAQYACARFGHDVDHVGRDTLIVSAPDSPGIGPTNGCVYVYNALGVRRTVITAPVGRGADPGFGTSISALEGTGLFAVGAPGYEDGIGNMNVGEAYVYNTNGVRLKILTNPSATPVKERFGTVVQGVGASRIAIGAPGADGARGRVYLMTPDASLIATLTNPVAVVGHEFGSAIARIGNTHFAVGGRAGERVFLYDINGNLVRVISNPRPDADRFGSALNAPSGALIVVGAPSFKPSGIGTSREGRAYVYNTNGVLVRTIAYPLTQVGARPPDFGFAIAALGPDYNLISAPYALRDNEIHGRVFMLNRSGDVMATILNPAEAATPEFGWSIAAVDTNVFIVGSPLGISGLPFAALDLGLAHIFRTEHSLPDRFEPDDTRRQARAFRLGDTEIRDFHEPGDQDWVKFFVHSNFVYEVTVEALGQNSFPTAELFRENRDGTLRVYRPGLDVKTKRKTGLSAGPPRMPQTTVVISNAATGFYYLPINSGDTNLVGKTTEYSLNISAKGNTTALVVIAVDLLSEGGGSAPPGTEVLLTGFTNFSIRTGNTITITGIPAGNYEVGATGAEGYVPDEDPAAPGQPGNTNSILYGNPKNVVVAVDQFNFAVFTFLPIVTAQGIVRDADTGAWVDNAHVGFEALTGAVAGLVFTQFPFASSWSASWNTDAGGRFPADVLLPVTDYDLFITRDGYESMILSNALTGANAGDTNALGTLYLSATDTNLNGIGDWWETLHFGGSTSPTQDPDLDGYDNLTEYRTGTDPTNADSKLTFDLPNPPGANPFVVTWPVVGGHDYEVIYADSLSGTSGTTGFGPWTAPSNGTQSWSDPGSVGATGRYYRIKVHLP